MPTLRPEERPSNPIRILDETLSALDSADHAHDRALLVLASLRLIEQTMRIANERLARVRAAIEIPADDRGSR